MISGRGLLKVLKFNLIFLIVIFEMSNNVLFKCSEQMKVEKYLSLDSINHNCNNKEVYRGNVAVENNNNNNEFKIMFMIHQTVVTL